MKGGRGLYTVCSSNKTQLTFRILDQNRSICTAASSVIPPNSEIKEILLVNTRDLSSGVFVVYKAERRASNARIHTRSV